VGAARTLVFGHRGGRTTAGDRAWPAENALAAFERAFDEGADGVELDVRRTRDDVVVVMHDRDLERATAGADAREVESLTYEELARVGIFGGERAPTLREVLALCMKYGGRVNVEIKHDVRDAWSLARGVVRELASRPDGVVVSSFDPRMLLRARALGLAAPTAVLTDRSQRYAMPLARLVARPPLMSGVHLERSQATRARVERLRARGLFVGVWTVNDGDEARALADAGVDWLITDAPARIRAALGRP
jgi:glycerophosphoryl diester phosphodiesterase